MVKKLFIKESLSDSAWVFYFNGKKIYEGDITTATVHDIPYKNNPELVNAMRDYLESVGVSDTMGDSDKNIVAMFLQDTAYAIDDYDRHGDEMFYLGEYGIEIFPKSDEVTESVKEDVEMDDEITKVIFKKHKSGKFKGEVTAIFPDLPANRGHLVCFDTVSGHGECDYGWVISDTVPATPDEYKDTYDMLTNNYGYNLKVVRRVQASDTRKAWQY